VDISRTAAKLNELHQQISVKNKENKQFDIKIDKELKDI
jgi:hypothetical protein